MSYLPKPPLIFVWDYWIDNQNTVLYLVLEFIDYNPKDNCSNLVFMEIDIKL